MSRTLSARLVEPGARALARSLMRIEGVEAVIAAGSLGRGTRFTLGRSDIDLFLVVDVPTLNDEMALRRGLSRWLRRTHALLRVVRELSYVDRDSFPIVALQGSLYPRRLALTGRVLAGHVDWPLAGPLDEVPWSIRCADMVRRWNKTSSFVLGRERSPGCPRAVKRLFGDIVAAREGVDRDEPPARLLSLAASGEATARIVLSGGRATVATWLQACLEQLEVLAAGGPAHLRTTAPPPSTTPTLPGLTEARPLLVLPTPAEAVRVGAARLRGWSFEQRKQRPLVLTDALWSSAILLPPAPLMGLALAPELVPRGGDQEWDALVASRVANALYRVRSRVLRVRESRVLLERRTRSEVARWLPALGALRRGEMPDVEAALEHVPRSEREAIERMRRFIEVERAALATAPAAGS